METTGLASLEAAFLNCSLVVSPNGDTSEYFGDFAEFCDPADVDSIRDATVRAWGRLPSRELKQRIEERFTWTEAARATLAGYRRALETAP
jgi:glycosyltransferase involved in cell wall biosynthesis